MYPIFIQSHITAVKYTPSTFESSQESYHQKEVNHEID